MEHQSVLNKPVSMTTWQLAHISYYFRWPNHKAIQINIANGCLGILLHCYSLFTLHLHLPKWLSRRHWFHNITTTSHVRHAMPITMPTYTGFTWSQHHKQPHSSYDTTAGTEMGTIHQQVVQHMKLVLQESKFQKTIPTRILFIKKEYCFTKIKQD